MGEAREVMLLTILLVVVLTPFGCARGHPQGLTDILTRISLELEDHAESTTAALGDVGQGDGGVVDAGFEGTSATNRVFIVFDGGVSSQGRK